MPMHMKPALRTKLWKPSQENRLQVGTRSCWHSHESGHRIPDCMGAKARLRALPKSSCRGLSLRLEQRNLQAGIGSEWLRDWVHLRIWVWIAFKSKFGLLCRYCTYKTSPWKAKSYWKPARFRCKILPGLLQSEKPEISAERRWAQGLAAHCKQDCCQTTLLPNP